METRGSRGHRREGFTLIELLIVIAIIGMLAMTMIAMTIRSSIVIAIIGMLAAIITAGVTKAREGARKAEGRTDVDSIGNALSAYHSDHGIYPGASEPAEETINSFPILYENLCGERPPEGKGGRNSPYVDLRIDKIVIIEDEEESIYEVATKDDRYDPDTPKYYLDPWSEPYIYRENKSKRERADYMIKRHHYDLWSKGPNGVDDSYLGDVEDNDENDDLGNW